MQYLSLVVTIGAAVAMAQYSNHGETVWKNDTLVYSEPEIPLQFNQNSRGQPLIFYSVSSQPIDYVDGESLYLRCHRGGWERCRKRFYEERNLHWERHVISRPLPTDEWMLDHQLAALNDGYDACCVQLRDLQRNDSNKQLREKIGYSVHWIQGPLLFAFFAGLFAFAIFRPTINLKL